MDKERQNANKFSYNIKKGWSYELFSEQAIYALDENLHSENSMIVSDKVGIMKGF